MEGGGEWRGDWRGGGRKVTKVVKRREERNWKCNGDVRGGRVGGGTAGARVEGGNKTLSRIICSTNNHFRKNLILGVHFFLHVNAVGNRGAWSAKFFQVFFIFSIQFISGTHRIFHSGRSPTIFHSGLFPELTDSQETRK